MQYAGDTRYAMLHLDRIKEDCREALTTNTSLWARDALHNFPVPPQDVVDFLCLNDCSGHGQCSSGESQPWESRNGNIWEEHKYEIYLRILTDSQTDT